MTDDTYAGTHDSEAGVTIGARGSAGVSGAAGVGVERLRASTVLVMFAAFGALWGIYAAALPVIKGRTGAGDGALGAVLACVGLAAAPTMIVVGRLLDRRGRGVAVVAICAFAVVAPLPLIATSVPVLVVTLVLFGAGSGACDVVINSLAAKVEAEQNVRVLNRAHALFSTGLLAGSIVTGVVRAGNLPVAWPEVLIGLLVVTTAIGMRRQIPRVLSSGRPAAADRPARQVSWVVAQFGAVAALAMLVESGVQQWSAVFLDEIVRAPAMVSGLAPGIFAGAMALGRMSSHAVSSRMSDRWLLMASGAISGIGVIVVSAASSSTAALVGFAVAGGAISVAAPTIYSMVGRTAPADRRGSAIGATASVGYVGLLLGPVVVGQIAGLTGLRTAMSALALVSLAVLLAGATVRAPAAMSS